MTWGDDIDHAMRKGRSPYTAGDLIGWLRSGDAAFAATPRMSASVWFHDGIAEVGHIAGKWSYSDARWLYAKLQSELSARGVTDCTYRGRKGWPRFFRMKGKSNVSRR